MSKLKAYESALALYGTIFSQLKGKNERYFFGTIKRDFVFFLFALIWKGACGASALKSKSRLLPKNFNEWTFGRISIVQPQNDPSLWNIDREYFRNNGAMPRTAEGIAILGCGIDFEKSFDFASLARERKILTLAKKSRAYDIKSLPFFLQNFIALFSIHRLMKKSCQLHCSLAAFLRYFIYYAFASARFRSVVFCAANNSSIGKVMSSDLDNVIGNSFILWSNFYGLPQIAYPHGSPVSLNRNRYFKPKEYYVWTIYQKKYAQDTGNRETKFISITPKWAQDPPPLPIQSRAIKKIIIVTAMEENLEIPFGNRDILLSYIGEVAKLAARKNISVFIKSHKLLDWHDDYNNLCKKYGNLIHVKKRWRTEQLREIDLAILMNTSTTMALQLLSLGIPAITCREVMSEIVPKHFSAPYFDIVVKNKAELLNTLRNIISSNELYREAQGKSLAIFSAAIKI